MMDSPLDGKEFAVSDSRRWGETGARAAALIPAYNEQDAVGDVVTRTRGFIPDVLVVDDGSEDSTASVAAQAGAEVLRHPGNCGKGVAIRTGLRYLGKLGFDRAVVLDADGQHLPEEIPVLLAESDANPGALILSVRKKEGRAIACANLFANWLADGLVSALTGQTFSDSQSGFRLYPIAAILDLGTRGERMEFETEVLIAACHANIPLREVRTGVYYPPVNERRSHYRPVEDTLRIGWAMLEAAVNLRKAGIDVSRLWRKSPEFYPIERVKRVSLRSAWSRSAVVPRPEPSASWR